MAAPVSNPMNKLPSVNRSQQGVSRKEKPVSPSFSDSFSDSEEDDCKPEKVFYKAVPVPANAGAKKVGVSLPLESTSLKINSYMPDKVSYHPLKFVLPKDSKAVQCTEQHSEVAPSKFISSKRTLQSTDAIKESKKTSSPAPIPSASKPQYQWASMAASASKPQYQCAPMAELNKKQKRVDSSRCPPVGFPESPAKLICQDVFVPTFPAAKASPQLSDPRSMLAQLKSLPNHASDSDAVLKAKRTLSFFKTIDLSSAFSCQKELKNALWTLLAEDTKNSDGSSNLISLQKQFDRLSVSFDRARRDLLETNDLLAKKENVKHQQQDFKQTYCANLRDGCFQCGRIVFMFGQEIAQLEEKLKEAKSKLLEARGMQASFQASMHHKALCEAEKGILECDEEEGWLARKVEAERQINAAEKEWEEMKELIVGGFPTFKAACS